MAATGDMLRRMDYLKRAKNSLGLKTPFKATKIMECSTFVRSANERHKDLLHNAVRKMEAEERLYKDVHSKQLSSVRQFRSTVHSRSASLDRVAPSAALPTSCSDTTLCLPAADDDSSARKSRNSTPDEGRRGSLPWQAGSAAGALLQPTADHKRRHSGQGDGTKVGRSFRKLREVIAPGSKARVCPEPHAEPKSLSASAGDSLRSAHRVVLVAEART